MVSLGLLAGGLIKGIGDGMQQDIQYQREMALELLRENRRARERSEDRAFAVEDRDYSAQQDLVKFDRQTEMQDQRDEKLDARSAAREDRLDARAAARDEAMLRRSTASGGGEGRPPAEVQTATWLAGLEERAVTGDESAKRTIGAYNRVTQAKTSDANLAKERAKMVIETAKDLNTYEGGMQDKPYAERKAEAERIVDDLLQYGSQPAAAEPRPQPGGGMMRKPESSISDELTNRRMERAVQSEREAPAATAGPTRIKSQAEYEALPSGARFIDPEGRSRIKP